MMSVKLILRYPSGERRSVNAIYKENLAWEYIGIYPFGYKTKKTYMIYQGDIGYENSFLGSILPINDYRRVVDIDVNARESMRKIDEVITVLEDREMNEQDLTISPSLDEEKIIDETVKDQYILRKTEYLGTSLKSRCTNIFDTKKASFLDVYRIEKLKIQKKTLDISSIALGFGLGGLAVMVLQTILEATQGIGA